MIKMLRFGRLLRLVRILQYDLFKPLVEMVLGVIAGVRVLIWAIILLIVCIYALGVMLRITIGDEEVEFATVSASMLSIFRCCTDGCTAQDGRPLHARLLQDYGAWFFIAYGTSFMFVTLGIFNLIAAMFVENIHTSSQARRLEELDLSRKEDLKRIGAVLANLIASEDDMHCKPDDEGVLKPVITREMFNRWLDSQDMQKLFEEVDIQTSCQGELFDVLDIDAGGELSIDELLVGLMRMKGPITKTDVVAIRLNVRHLNYMIMSISEYLLSEQDGETKMGTSVTAGGAAAISEDAARRELSSMLSSIESSQNSLSSFLGKET